MEFDWIGGLESEPKTTDEETAAKIIKYLAAHFCGCSCHHIFQIGVGVGVPPCPRCEGKTCGS